MHHSSMLLICHCLRLASYTPLRARLPHIQNEVASYAAIIISYAYVCGNTRRAAVVEDYYVSHGDGHYRRYYAGCQYCHRWNGRTRHYYGRKRSAVIAEARIRPYDTRRQASANTLLMARRCCSERGRRSRYVTLRHTLMLPRAALVTPR